MFVDNDHSKRQRANQTRFRRRITILVPNRDVGRRAGAECLASAQRCRTAVAGCMGENAGAKTATGIDHIRRALTTRGHLPKKPREEDQELHMLFRECRDGSQGISGRNSGESRVWVSPVFEARPVSHALLATRELRDMPSEKGRPSQGQR